VYQFQWKINFHQKGHLLYSNKYFKRGVVLLPNDTLQISPLSHRLRNIIMQREATVIAEGQGPEAVPHLVRRAPLMPRDSLLGDAGSYNRHFFITH